VQPDGTRYKLVSVAAGQRRTGVVIAFKDAIVVDYGNGRTFALMSREGDGQLGVWADVDSKKVGTARRARAKERQ
jgi:hypothetical protein